MTASATGDPLVGGTGYSLTCDHDAPLSLNATVQSTLVTPGGFLTHSTHSGSMMVVSTAVQLQSVLPT